MLITVFSNSLPDSHLYLLLTASRHSPGSPRDIDDLKIQVQEKITESRVCAVKLNLQRCHPRSVHPAERSPVEGRQMALPLEAPEGSPRWELGKWLDQPTHRIT